jgi:hypothetical protein
MKIVIAGHSHVCVFQFWSHNQAGFIPLPLLDGQVLGFCTMDGPYHDSYWDELVEHAAGKTIVILWLGSQHLAEFLFAPDQPFDFFLSRHPGLPLQCGAQLIPESVVREYQSYRLIKLDAVIKRLKDQPDCRILLCATPPPKGDDDALRPLMIEELFFQTQGELWGLDLTNVALTPPIVRLKLWLVIDDLIQKIAGQNGVAYIPVPQDTRNHEGFLKSQYWRMDVGHANYDYGMLVMDAIKLHLDAS